MTCERVRYTGPMATRPTAPSRSASACLALALALCAHLGCDDSSNSPKINNRGKANLCRDYLTCDECIEGQQDRGFKKPEAESMCGLAVMGCFTNWEKPIRCGGKDVDVDESDAVSEGG